MTSIPVALVVGLIAFVVGTIAFISLPHIVESEMARGIIGALVTGFSVYVGLTLLDAQNEST